MSKYDELKQRIEALDNGWDKEADDVIRELEVRYYISISTKIDGVEIQDNNREKIEYFGYNTQCEKLTAFKNALLWLLDHSDIKKDEKQEKIEELQLQVNALNKTLEELRK